MSFTSLTFIVFIAIVTGVYYAVPKRLRWIALLISGYVFYFISSPKTMIFLIMSTIVTFAGGRRIGRYNSHHRDYIREHEKSISREEKKQVKAETQRKKRYVVALVLVFNFGVLAAVKYFGYYIELLLKSAEGLRWDAGVIIPLGISFYTFQSAAYIIDLYRTKIEADDNIFKFALFMSFFPQIIQGPIPRYSELSGQLYRGNDFSYKNFTHGMQLILWGFFKKMVIADRVSVAVNQVFDNYQDYHGGIIIVALLLYTVQIYADFSGGIDIARGTGQMLGIHMAHNFMRPYFSDNLSEFWRRWHISLSFWCRDYIFFPISLSKTFGKAGKRLRSVFGDRVGKLFPVIIAQMATFITIGLWHGAEFKYVAYGLYNGFIIVLGLLLEPYLKNIAEKLGINQNSEGWKRFEILRTFAIVVLGRIFPRALSFSAAIAMLKSVFIPIGVSEFFTEIVSLGMGIGDFIVIAASCILWYEISSRQEKGIKIRDALDQKHTPLRWFLYLAALASVIILGTYGPEYDPAAFIYRGF